ncbi:MAG TPA: inosine/xanthosine triphosphatase [Planctomycetota bacterium]|nr:inosine/xanthosine triphosphatase [Planctomycetota bacterium]
MIVRVGSANPMKVRAVRRAFATFFGKVKVVGMEVPSGVSSQPLSFGEIVRGARQRSRRAFGDCDYSVGIEAGVFRVASVSSRPFQITMACVFDGSRDALGSGPFYEVPPGLVRQVVDSDRGSVWVVTKGKVTRAEVTAAAIVMALAPFVSADRYR